MSTAVIQRGRTSSKSQILPNTPTISSSSPILTASNSLDNSSHMESFDLEVEYDSKKKSSSILSSRLFYLVLAWITMAMAVFAGSTIGPIFRYMMSKGVTPCLAASWRCQAMSLCLIPFAFIEAFYMEKKFKEKKLLQDQNKNNLQNIEAQIEGTFEGEEEYYFPFPYKEKPPTLPYPLYVHVLISGIAWAANLLLWIVALQFISTFKASIVATCHPIILVVSLYFTAPNLVSKLEAYGVFIAFFGMIASNFSELLGKNEDSSSSDISSDFNNTESFPALNITSTVFSTLSTTHPHGGSEDEKLNNMPIYLQMLGVLLCFLSAVSEVVVIFNRIETRKYIPLIQYTTVTTIIVSISSTILTIFFDGTHLFNENSYSLCLSGSKCVLGWLDNYWIYKILLFGLWIGAVCITGMNYAMQYIPPLVFSSIGLLDPSLTAVISWLLGLESLPYFLSWIGGFVVIGGVALIMYGEHQRELASHIKPSNESTNGSDKVVFSKLSTVDEDEPSALDDSARNI